MLERITELYRIAEETRLADMEAWYEGECNRDRFMVDRKKHLEAWILGRFADGYNSNTDRALVWAESGEAPDFAVFDRDKQLVSYVEVTEWLDSERKRDKEYSGTPRVGARLIDDDPARAKRDIDHLHEQLEKKFARARKYPQNTWLLIYINVVGTLFWQFKDADIFRRETDIVAQVIANLSVEQPRSISQIWVLNPTRSTESVIHRIFPDRWRCSGNWLSTNLDK